MARGLKFRFRKKRDFTIHVAKTKALISFAVTAKVTAKLVCVFVFAYAKRWFSHDPAQMFLIICLTVAISKVLYENMVKLIDGA